MPKQVDLTGRTDFGQLSVIGFAGRGTDSKGNKHKFWHCTCTCGGNCTVTTTDLTAGRVYHCPQCQPQREARNYRQMYLQYMETFTQDEWRKLAVALLRRASNRVVAEAVEVIMVERKKAA